MDLKTKEKAMKKKVLILISVLVMSSIGAMNAHSQVLISLLLGDKLNSGKIEFGITGGFYRSQFIQQSDADHLGSLALGFYFNFYLKEHLYLYTGVRVKAEYGGTNIPIYSLGDEDLDGAFAEGSITRRIPYFNVPIALKYRFNNHIFMDAGIQPSLMHGARDVFSNTINDKDDLNYKVNMTDQITRLDFGFVGGLGYQFKKGIGMSIGAKYYYGVVDIYKDDRYATNSNLYLYAEIPIGANKAKKKAEKN